MPSADPDEAALFLARLAGHDAALPPCPHGTGFGPDHPLDAS